MDKQVLEAVLERSVRDVCTIKIIDDEVVPALDKKGENFTSAVERLKLKVVLGNGRVVKKSLILKRGNGGQVSDKLEIEFNLSGNEAMVYSVIKEMGFMMDEFEDHDDPLWCEFIYYEPKSRSILLEDLKPKGFKVITRQSSLDLEHTLLVLQSLGRFHGMAKVLEERGILWKSSFQTYPATVNETYRHCFLYAGMKSLGKAMKKYWGPEWELIANKILMPMEEFVEKLENCIKVKEGDFICLNHGDCWSNNMMFKYDWQNRPISLRFLDFQVPFYNSPCLDISYFLSVSVQPAIRRQNYSRLIQCYHSSLVCTLKKFGFKGDVPTLKAIMEKMQNLSFYRSAALMFLYPAFTSDSKTAMDIEELVRTKGEFGLEEEIYKSKELIDNIGADLKDFVQQHFS